MPLGRVYLEARFILDSRFAINNGWFSHERKGLGSEIWKQKLRFSLFRIVHFISAWISRIKIFLKSCNLGTRTQLLEKLSWLPNLTNLQAVLWSQPLQRRQFSDLKIWDYDTSVSESPLVYSYGNALCITRFYSVIARLIRRLLN